MAINTNRQTLIHLHSGADKKPVGALNLGEIAVQHNSVEGAALYVETVINGTEDSLAKFITEKAIDAKIGVVSGYTDTVANNLAAEITRATGAEGGLNTRLEAVEAQLGSSEGGNSFADRVNTLEGAVEDLVAEDAQIRLDFAAADTALDGKITGLDTRMGTAEGKITSLEGRMTTAEGAIATNKAAHEANAAAIEQMGKDYKADDAALKSELQGNIDAVVASANANGQAITRIESEYKAADVQMAKDYKAADDVVRGEFAAADAALKTAYEAADTALGQRIDNLATSAETAAKAAKTEVAEGTDAGNNMSIVKTVGANGQDVYTINLTDVASAAAVSAMDEAYKAADESLQAAIDAMDEAYKAADQGLQGSINEVSGKVTTLIGDDADMSARAIVIDEVAKQLKSENISESFDTLKEMAEYLSSHPQTVTDMNNAIEANATEIGKVKASVGTLPEGKASVMEVIEANELVTSNALTNLDTRVSGNTTAIAENKAAHEANAGAITGLDTRLQTAEGKVGTLETKMGTAEGNITDLQTRMGAAEGKVSTLETTVGNAESGLVKSVADNAAAISALESAGFVKGIAAGKASGVVETEQELDFSALTINCGEY